MTYLSQTAVGMFSLPHIFYMVGIVLVSLLVGYWSRTFTKKQLMFTIRVITVIMLTLDPLYWVNEYLTTGGFEYSTILPLYYCSITWIILPFLAWGKEGTRIHRIALSFVASFNILVGCLGTIFNVYLNDNPFLSFIPMRSLFYHGLMILVGVLVWMSKYYKPRMIDLKYFFIPVLILFVPAFIVDYTFNWDYCYLRYGGVGTPVEIFSSPFPMPVFIIIKYTVLYVGTTLIFYLPMILSNRRKNRKNEEEIHDESDVEYTFFDEDSVGPMLDL